MSDLIDVHLMQLPVRLWAQAQEHSDALRREFALITLGSAESHHDVPRRLLELMARLDAQFAGIADAPEAELREAADAGRLVIEDLVYQVPAAAAQAATEIETLLTQADVYCAEGTHLLTLSSSEQVVAFRRWFLAQFVDQIAGNAPVGWPDWS